MLEAQLFGEFLRTLRESKGLTLREVAERAHLSHTALSNYELGKRLPSDQVLSSLALALEVSYDELNDQLWEARAQSLLRANRRLSSMSREQIMQFIKFAREQDRKAREKGDIS